MSANRMEKTRGRAGPVYGAKEAKLNLSELLSEGTKEIQEEAMNSQFLKDFLRGRVHNELFKFGVVALYYIYAALEKEIERNKDHHHFAPLYFPTELHRNEALGRDLEYFYGPNWQSQIGCSPATKHYVDRIHQVGRKNPVLLVAHAYACYMGGLCGGQLLSGGRVLRNVAQRNLNLPSTGEGLEFYQFNAIDSAPTFKQLYRSRMNELVLDIGNRQRLVSEAVQAFRFNMEVLKELEDFGMTMEEEEEEEEEEEVVDAGPPVLEAIDRDISKFYYYMLLIIIVGTACVCLLVMDLIRPSDVLLTSCITTLVGLAAWYLM